MQSILDACAEGRINAEVRVVISNNSSARALERAEAHSITTFHLSSVTHDEPDDLEEAILEKLESHEINVVVLAGYMKRIGPRLLTRFQGCVLNTHPALLPKYGGQGMYGDRVHEAVLAAGETESGASVHVVDDDYDTGRVLSSVEVPVEEDDTPETLRDRVQEAEREHYVTVLERIARGEIELEGLRR
jgi:phosphoribosylglycinamide formyltransferase-1